jgi:arsenite-transporting ATPase
MPPTALTLRFFSLPFITLIWLQELLKLRRLIYDKKEIISKIKVGRKEIEQDKVKARLEKLIDNYEHLRRHFLSDAARINLVMNNDRLSFSETYRIRHKLGQIGIAIDRVVVNKLTPGEPIDDIENAFKAQPLMRLPAATATLAGHEVLKQFVQANRNHFAHF